MLDLSQESVNTGIPQGSCLGLFFSYLKTITTFIPTIQPLYSLQILSFLSVFYILYPDLLCKQITPTSSPEKKILSKLYSLDNAKIIFSVVKLPFLFAKYKKHLKKDIAMSNLKNERKRNEFNKWFNFDKK